MARRVVVALGGNALGKNIEEQHAEVKKTASVIVDMIEKGYELIITHGNGPQVGTIQRAMDDYSMLSEENKQIPLPNCVAMSQGYIGIDLQNAIKAEIANRGLDKKVSTILSQVEVDSEDPAFKNPTKPIGRFMTKEEADKLAEAGISVMEDAGRGYRIAVASPMPKRIVELMTVKTLLAAGHTVITCGGGGIPVVMVNGELRGADAVIDKDNASCLLAQSLDADQLMILTAVEKVAINFGKENQQWLSEMTTEEARKYIEEGQFSKGSMLPKVEASVRFAESKEGRSALIALLDRAADALEGKTGTLIHQ